MNIVLETKDMKVGYGRQIILSSVNLQVEKGEITALIGPNGAGKSTILKTIAGQLRKAGGEVFVEDEALEQIDQLRLAKKMAFVPTEKIRQEQMTCEEIVQLGRYPHTGRWGLLSSEDRKRTEEALKTVGAYELKDRDYTKISDGQKQKVRLAMAICQDTDIIVLDEPTSFLDIRHKIEILEILRTMAGRGKTIIMSLHELELVRLVADRILCVREGNVVCYGSVDVMDEKDFINRLFEIRQGSFASLPGVAFMQKNTEPPRVFVIGGNGAGIPVYRKLHRNKIPFATGILQENDIDAHFATEMTDYVICAGAFQKAGEEQYRQAVLLLDQCEKMIVAQQRFGETNQINEALINEAGKRKMEIIW